MLFFESSFPEKIFLSSKNLLFCNNRLLWYVELLFWALSLDLSQSILMNLLINDKILKTFENLNLHGSITYFGCWKYSSTLFGSMNLLTILLNAARYFIFHFFDFFWGKYYLISWFHWKLIFISYHPFKSLYPFWILFNILYWTSFSCANVCYHVCRIYSIPFFNFSKSSYFDFSVSHPLLDWSFIIIDPIQDNLAVCKLEWFLVMVAESYFNDFSSAGVKNSSK